jgi:DNA-binding NarL/FixJ family response regulator
VAEGLTNREVGRRLHISPHTVNTHLRHVFQKLSVSTRAELAGKVARGSAGGITHSSDVSPPADVEAGH